MASYTIEQAFDLALKQHQAGLLGEAEGLYRQILAAQPHHSDALHLLGVIAGQTGHEAQGIELMTRAITLAPGQFLYRENHIRLLLKMGKPHEAIQACRQAIGMQMGEALVHSLLGQALEESGDDLQAAMAYEQSLRLEPMDGDTRLRLGLLRERQGNLPAAAECMRQCLAHRADDAAALTNLGRVLRQLDQHEEALQCGQRSVQINPQHPIMWFNLAEAQVAAGRAMEAVESYRRAITLQPEYAAALINLGNLLQLNHRLDEAVTCYRQVLAKDGHIMEGLVNLAGALFLQGLHEESMAIDRRALAQHPKLPIVHSGLIYSMQYAPGISGEAILEEARRWNARHGEPFRSRVLPHQNDRSPDRPLRVGYVATDFYDHCQSLFTVPLFSHHDPAQVQIFVYSAVVREDAVTKRLRRDCAGWRDILRMSDDQAAALVREDGIDILVDQMMHMSTSRLPLFSRKPAPVQVTWLAYPGTTGLWAMDYRLTDPCLDPPGKGGMPGPFDHRYSETSIRLRDTFWCFDPQVPSDLAPVNPLPALTAGMITFGSLNNFCKVDTRAGGIVSLWAQVLHAVPRSRMLILASPGSHQARTSDAFAREGIDPMRIGFVPMRRRFEYLKNYHRIDIGLDTAPYNGHTTSLDSYWMGVPVITLVGTTVVGRAGLSQLTNLGLTELVAHTREEYVRIAAALAADLPRLAEMRRTLRERMQASPLMDAARFARAMESAFREMWRRWCGQG